MKPFTVVIPVLNRADTLAHALASCLAQADADFQILVSDNLSDDDSAGIAEAAVQRDPRVRVIRPSRRLGQSKHWEFALSHVTEGFFMLLGADDALLPGSVTRARQFLVTHPEMKALHGIAPPMYSYPELENAHAGHLSFSPDPFLEIRKSREWLLKVLQGKSSILNLPFAYGMAWMDISILQEVKARTGSLIPCRTAPVFFTIAAALFCEEYLCVTPGFGCPAASASSIGYSVHSAKGDRARDQVYFAETDIAEKDIPFHPSIGASRSEHMHVAETLLTLQGVGLLPAELEISWDRLVALAYRDLTSTAWNDADRQDNWNSLKKTGENLGCPHIMALAEKHPALPDWEAHLPFTLEPAYSPPSSVMLDLRPLGVREVYGASVVAGSLLAEYSGDDSLRPPTSVSNLGQECAIVFQALGGVKKYLDQMRVLEREVVVRIAESARRGAERDRTKQQVATLREQVQKLQADLKKNPAASGKTGWSSRLLARLRRR